MIGDRTSAIVETLDGKRRNPPPLWLMRQAGRYLPEYRGVRAQTRNFLEFCYNSDLAAEVTLQPMARYDLDAAIIFSDILVVCDAVGIPVWFVEGEGPRLEPVRSSDGLAKLSVEGVVGKLQPVYRAIASVRSSLDASKALIGFAGAPWTLAAYATEGRTSRDFEVARTWAWSDPDGFGQLIRLLSEAIVRHLVAQFHAGADVVQLFDSWAGVLAPDQFERWVVEPTRDIVARVRAEVPGARIIGFPRGAGGKYICYAQKTGVTAVGLDTGVDPVWAAREIPSEIVLQGNLDPLAVVSGGRAMAEQISRILAAYCSRPFVFNLGHGVVPATPPEHVAELVSLVRGQGKSR
ncbi:MAG: uroporphyrinogen decarboxylase [Alphaproteobacteria bacterium]